MGKNFKLVIEYEGTPFHGWQRQNDLPTVQGEIEKVLSVMTRQRVDLHGSGRTDAGVHAVGQVANFTCDTKITPEAFGSGLNSLLPDPIAIRECIHVPEDFHARFSAKDKTYRYRILNRPYPSAIARNFAWFLHKDLDVDAMDEAAKRLLGTHDFKSFEGVGSPRPHTVREVMKAGFTREDEDNLLFEIKGNGFLKYMVRNIMGTLVDVGSGKISPERFSRIILEKDRRKAGTTAPPHGLCLMRVGY